VSAMAQKNRCSLCIIDSISLSPSAKLSFYWWDPYHLHLNEKVLSPEGADEESYRNQEPPYSYCFRLKKGILQGKIFSCFNDSIVLDLNLQKDTTLYFQQLVKDFYQLTDSSENLLANITPGDKITLHIAKIFSNSYEGLRIDLEANADARLEIQAVNRKPFDDNKKNIDIEAFQAQLSLLETAARELREPSEFGYVLTLRKNKKVIEYKGKSGSAKLGQVLNKLKKILLIE
jgi:hypothetical protein